MKLNVLILLFFVALTVLFSGCRNCYSCLAEGENFDLPYSPGQTITYVNDSNIQMNFSVAINGGWPDDEYCGRIGSGSYGKCGASASAMLQNSQDSLTIGIGCNTSYNDNVELYVTRQVGVGKWLMSVNKGVASAEVPNGSVHKIESISIGGKPYSNVYEYQNSSVGIHECTDFVYSVEYGVLRFTIRLADSVENWELVR